MLLFDVREPVRSTVLNKTAPSIAYCGMVHVTQNTCQVRASYRYAMQTVSKIRTKRDPATMLARLVLVVSYPAAVYD